jgi:hypothetical protein
MLKLATSDGQTVVTFKMELATSDGQIVLRSSFH